MTLFGQTLDGQQLFGLISLLTMLAFWLVVWRRERASVRWFREWEARRKARRQAEARAARGPGDGPGGSHSPGPWG